MLSALRQWAACWGDVINLAGLLLAVIGFGVTIYGVYRSKNAAQKAREAADDTKDMLVRTNTIVDFSAALTIMDEIMRLHRSGANWLILPDRYSSLRDKLTGIVASHPSMSEAQRLSVGKALSGIRSIESTVEKSLAEGGSSPPNVVKLNQIMRTHLDALRAVLAALRVEVRGEPNA